MLGWGRWAPFGHTQGDERQPSLNPAAQERGVWPGPTVERGHGLTLHWEGGMAWPLSGEDGAWLGPQGKEDMAQPCGGKGE